MLTASRPEAQKRLSWTPATVCGSPALIAAVLAMSAPWSPIGETQPSTTSSTLGGSRSTLRESISCIRPTTRSTGLVECNEPLLLPFPRGVRMASKTSASLAAMDRSPLDHELVAKQYADRSSVFRSGIRIAPPGGDVEVRGRPRCAAAAHPAGAARARGHGRPATRPDGGRDVIV